MSKLVNTIIGAGLSGIGTVTGKKPIKNAGRMFKNAHIHYAEENIRPNYHFVGYNDISTELLKVLGIELIINDVDGNLMGYHDQEVAEELKETFEDHRKNFKVVLLSNSSERRFRELGTIFPNDEVVRVYRDKEGQMFYRVLHQSWDRIMAVDKNGSIYDENETESVRYANPKLSGDSIRPDGKPIIPMNLKDHYEISKPDAILTEIIMQAFGVDSPSKVAWIGDRLSTEITGGNQGGATTFWVDEYEGNQPEPWFIKRFARTKEAEIAKKYEFKDKYGKIPEKPIKLMNSLYS